MHVVYTRWRSPPTLHHPIVWQHFLVRRDPPYSQNSAPWIAPYGFLPLIGFLDDDTGYYPLIFRFITFPTFLHTFRMYHFCVRERLSHVKESIQHTEYLCSKIPLWYLCLLSTDSEYLINTGYDKMGHSRHSDRQKEAQQGYVIQLYSFINLFASLTKLKFSCNHEYMNEAATETAHWRADKIGQYQ